MGNGFLVRAITRNLNGFTTEEWFAHVLDRYTAIEAVEREKGPSTFVQVIDEVPHATLLELGIPEGQISRSRS